MKQTLSQIFISLDALYLHFILSVICDCVVIFNIQIIMYSQNTNLYNSSIEIPDLK